MPFCFSASLYLFGYLQGQGILVESENRVLKAITRFNTSTILLISGVMETVICMAISILRFDISP